MDNISVLQHKLCSNPGNNRIVLFQLLTATSLPALSTYGQGYSELNNLECAVLSSF